MYAAVAAGLLLGWRMQRVTAKFLSIPAMGKDKDIIRAAKRGDVDLVRGLLVRDPSLVDARDRDGSTPLHCAAWKGHVEVARLLLDNGADIDAVNRNEHWGTTPLHAAAHGNQRAVAELLLAAGADAGAINLNGRTPLQETEIHDARSVARLLEDHLARPRRG